ncbi:MAG: hypothetical protein ABI761_07570 [Saprospiraceae bacterium]
MKKLIYVALFGMVFIFGCSKVNEDPDVQNLLEERGNDNHKIWKLSEIVNHWDYTLTDGFKSDGIQIIKYVYSCSHPVGRAIATTDSVEENGEVLWDNERTMAYNDNFMISTEQGIEYGDEVHRTYHYDAEGKWTGVTTEINGEVIEDEFEIGPGGLLKSYTSNGVRNVYEWKANNLSKIKTYILSTAAFSSVQHSSTFNHIGFNTISKNKTKEQILHSFVELQKVKRGSSGFRSTTDEWVLVFIEEQTADKNVIQPFSSAALGYPGTSSDGGYYTLPKNFIIQFKGYNINEDGTEGDLAYLYHFDSYKTKDNLPVDVKYSSFIADYVQDENGNTLDYNDHGTIHYEYISGCNQGKK